VDYHFGHAAAYGVPGAALTIGGLQVHSPAWIGYILMGCGVVLMAICIAIIGLCVYADAVSTYRHQREAAGVTTESVLLEQRARLCDRVRGLTDEQVKIVIENGILGVSFRLFDDEPLVHPTSVPYWFLYEFIGKSDEMFLCQIRNYSEGTNQRKWAQELTRLFVSRGEATLAHGNEQARWKSPELFKQYEMLAKHDG